MTLHTTKPMSLVRLQARITLGMLISVSVLLLGSPVHAAESNEGDRYKHSDHSVEALDFFLNEKVFKIPTDELSTIYRMPESMIFKYRNDSLISVTYFENELQLSAEGIDNSLDWFSCVFDDAFSQTCTATKSDRVRLAADRKIRRSGVTHIAQIGDASERIFILEYRDSSFARVILSSKEKSDSYYEIFFRDVPRRVIDGVLQYSLD